MLSNVPNPVQRVNTMISPFTHEEVSLETVWADEMLTQSLRTFAASEFVEESVAFASEVFEMKRANDPSRIHGIYAEYIRVGAPLELNLNHSTREAISTKVESATDPNQLSLEIFDEAFKEVIHLLETNLFQKFRQKITSGTSLELP